MMSILAAPGATSGQLKPEIERLFREHSEMLYCTAYSMLGNLYVQTKDMVASVSGAVSLVKAEEQGSRVAAIGGEVLVQQGTTEKRLRPGEQVTTNPKMESLPVKGEVAWSREAVAH